MAAAANSQEQEQRQQATSPAPDIATPRNSLRRENKGFQMLDLSKDHRNSDAETRTEDGDRSGSTDGMGLNGEAAAIAHGTYRVYRRRWFGLAVLMSMNIVISWGWLTFAPVSTSTKEYFGLDSETPVNWLSTVVLFAYVVASPVVIYTLNKHGLRPTLWSSSLLSLVGFWVRYAGVRAESDGKGSFGLTMFGQILIGFAQPFVLNAPTYFSDMWFTSRGRVSATALASLANPLGAAVGQVVNPFLATKAAEIPRMVLYVAIIATVPSLLAIFIPARPPTPPCPSSAETKLPLSQSLRVIAKSRDFWTIFIMFAVYLGFFNAFSSLINQIYEPYGYSADNAGFTGAVLIVVGLVSSAIVSPIIDRTHAFFLAIRVQVPLIALCYIVLIFSPTSPPNLAAPMTICAVLGAASFSLLPLSLECVIEQTHPVSPEVTSTMLWMGGQLLGGIFLISMDALRDDAGKDGRPKGNMWGALVFQAVIAAVVAPGVFLLRKRTNGNGRVEADEAMSVGSA